MARRIAAGSLLIVLIGAAAAAAEEAKPRLTAFRAGRVVPVEGPEVAPGVLLVKDGKVAKVQPAGDPLPEGAAVVDLGEGAVIAPALVNPLSQIHHLGQNPNLPRRGMIASAEGGPADNRRARAADGIDPRQEIFRRLAGTGYGAFALVPANGNFLSGLAAVARPGSPDAIKEKSELLIAEEGYLYLGYGTGESWRKLAEQELKKAAEEAKKILKGPEPPPAPPAESKEGAKKEAEKKEGEKKEPEKKDPEKKEDGPKPQPPQPPPPQPAPAPATPPAAGDKPKEAPPAPPKPPDPLVEAFLGKRPAFLYAGGPAVLDHLFRLLDSLPSPLSFVLVTVPLEPEVLARLAQRREQVQGVVLEPRLATFYDALIYRNAFQLFREAGFPVALVPISDDLKGHAEIFFHLAELVKTGVPEAVAWQAVTLTPARFLGQAERLGSLAPGREASFAVYRGDPFAGLPCLAHTYIRGEKVFSANPPEAPSAVSSSTKGEAVK